MSDLSGSLGNLAQQFGNSAIGGQVLSRIGPAVLSTLVEQLNQNGLGQKVNSWLGRGDNQPISPEEIQQALGNQTLQEMARSLGLPIDQITEVLAKNLPAAVDQASPNGTLNPAPPPAA